MQKESHIVKRDDSGTRGEHRRGIVLRMNNVKAIVANQQGKIVCSHTIRGKRAGRFVRITWA